MISSGEDVTAESMQLSDTQDSSVRITDLENGTARIEIARTMSWADVLTLMQLLEETDGLPTRQ